MKYLNLKQINYFFLNYKKRPTNHNLSNLYTELDPLVTDVTNNIAKKFRHTFPEDFADLQQQCRMDVFLVIDKICQISFSGEQLAKILVKVIIYAFIDNYNKYKKTRMLDISNPYLYAPDKNVYFSINIEKASGEDIFTTKYHGQTDRSNAVKALIYTNASQDTLHYINSLSNQIEGKIKQLNRYKDKEELVIFCFNSLFNSRNVSPKIIEKVWNVDNPHFWLDYTEVLLRLSIYDTVATS